MKISVIVPIYNVERFIDRCISSLLRQTYTDLEIILIDDGSPDNCGVICDNYASIDSRIKVVHKKNAGLGMACNSGLDVATGDYVAFCDSDDWVELDFYKNLLDYAIEYNADMVISGLKRVTPNGEFLSNLPHVQKTEVFKNNGIFVLAKDMVASSPTIRLDRRIQVSAKTILYRRSLLQNNKLRFVSERVLPSEDLIFNLSCLNHAKTIVCVPLYQYNYMVNPSSITSRVKKGHFSRMKNTTHYIKNLLISFVDNRESIDITNRTDRFLIGEARSQISQICRSGLSLKDKYQDVKDIYNDSVLKDIYSRYPISKMPFKHQVFLTAMRLKMFSILYLLSKLR